MTDSKVQNRLTGKLSSLIWHAERIILYDADCANDIGQVNWKKAKNLSINPFKGKSKHATLAIFKILAQDTISVYKIMNIDSTWHWFLVDNIRYKRYLDSRGVRSIDFIFCPTKRQYKLNMQSSPLKMIYNSRLGEEFSKCEAIDSPLAMTIYDEKTQEFEKKIKTSLTRWKAHLSTNLCNYIRQ